MHINFFSSAVLFASIASATKLFQEGTTPTAPHHDQNLFLSQKMNYGWRNPCWRTRERILEYAMDDDEFYTNINREDWSYIDEDKYFQHGPSVLYWDDQGEDDLDIAQKERDHDIEWGRAGEHYPDASLWGSEGVSVDDVTQGSIGNCWLCAAFASLAENPKAVQNAFLNTKPEQVPSGMYGVNLFVLGHPMTFVVDDYLPLVEQGTHMQTIFSKMSSDGSLWVPILEKVFAKRYGNYQHLIKGDSRDGLAALTGGPSVNIDHAEIEANDAATLWNLLLHHDSQGDYIQANTDGSDDQKTNAVGLVMGHAFTVLEAKELSNGVKLIKVRNPWGKEKYHGPWSDRSDKWTNALKDEVDLVVDNQDGIFWTDIDTYQEHFSGTHISYDATNWAQQKFLMIDDETDSPGEEQYCGETCTRHEFTLTSKVDQKVFITGHTWQQRSFSKKCQDTREGNPHHYMQVGVAGVRPIIWHYGDKALAPIDMKKGKSIDIITEWNFADGQHPPDWGISTYGNGAPDTLLLEHKGGLETESWLPIERDEDRT